MITIPHRHIIAMLPVLLLSNLAAYAADLDGVLAWQRRASLSTTVNGVVESVKAEPGMRVNKGDVLLQLEQPVFVANVSKARLLLKSANAKLEEADREAKRAQEMYDRTVLADHDLQVAKLEFVKAQAEVETARAALTQAESAQRHSVLRAPFDAYVIQRLVEEGEAVVTSLRAEPMLVLAEAGRMRVETSIDEGMLGKIKVGQAAEVKVGGNHYKGSVLSIGLETGAGYGSKVVVGADKYPVSIVFDHGSDVLRVGQKASVSLP